MKKNMGIFDRIIRLVVAAVLAVLFFTDVVSGVLGIVLLVIAGIFLITSLISVCPSYIPFRFSTRKKG
jgi:hypothetical protein